MAKSKPQSPKVHPQTQLNVFEPIERNFRQQEAGFDRAYAQSTSAEEKQQLRECLSAAEDAYWAAVADALADNSAFVVAIRDDLKAKNKAVAQELQDLQTVVSYLKLITEATRLAAALARLAAIA